MITITLQKICDSDLCHEGWQKVLKAHGHRAMNTAFPLSSVLKSNGLDDTAWCFRCLPEHKNLWRKYAVWCSRRVKHLMSDERSINALNVAWRHSDGPATDAELETARAVVRAAARAVVWDETRDAAWYAAWDEAMPAVWAVARDAAWAAAWAAAWVAEQDAQQKKLLQILTAGEWVDDGVTA